MGLNNQYFKKIPWLILVTTMVKDYVLPRDQLWKYFWNISEYFWSLKSRCQHAALPLEHLGENPHLFQLMVVAGIPSLESVSNFCVYPHIAFSSVFLKSPSFIVQPRYPPHFKIINLNLQSFAIYRNVYRFQGLGPRRHLRVHYLAHHNWLSPHCI